DGRSSSSAKGASGGGFNFDKPVATSEFFADVQSSVDAQRVRSGGNVEITTFSAAAVSAYSNSRSGGFVQVGDADADVNYDNRNNAFIGHATGGGNARNIQD